VNPAAVRAAGSADRVLVEGIVTYVGGAWRSSWVATVRDGKIARLEIFHEAPQAVLAAGLEA
jgi:hypothetical protein